MTNYTKRISKVKCPHCKHVFICDGTDKTKEVFLHMSIEHPKIFLKALSGVTV